MEPSTCCAFSIFSVPPSRSCHPTSVPLIRSPFHYLTSPSAYLKSVPDIASYGWPMPVPDTA
eukprot:1402539-Rhodomonas_salina.4